MRIVGVVSLSCGALLGWAQAACHGKGCGETSLLPQLDAVLSKGDIVLMDRFYAGYFTLARLSRLGVDFVSRQQARRRTDFRRGRRLGKADHVVRLDRPERPAGMSVAEYDALAPSMELRETRVGRWVLITSLTDSKSVSREELNRLYCWRWHVELDLRTIKSVMQMDVLRCKTPSMVLKEVAAHFLAYNLVRCAMAQAACEANVGVRELSFKGALQQLLAFEHQLRFSMDENTTRLHRILIESIASMKLVRRPNRVEPRVVKRRPKAVPLMSQPRSVLKAQLQTRHEQTMAAVTA